ncbi:hypothetical protein DXG01_009872 [Tephrocybe rancida]|nr:hypothetical protein DXG01_009872 [Tephrocybe rancida]
MPPRSRAVWDLDCECRLVDQLLKQHDEGMQTSNGNFHADAWTAIEKELAGTESVTGGTPKNVMCCSNKWGALKKDYREVKQLRDMSGFGWDDNNKLVTAEGDVWDWLIQAHPTLKKWRKNHFPLFDDIASLVEGTYATGAAVFRPGRDFTPALSDNNTVHSKPSDFIDPSLSGDSSEQSITSVVASAPPSASVRTVSFTETSNSTPANKSAGTTDRDEPGSTKHQHGHGRKQSTGQAISGMATSIAQLASAVANDAGGVAAPSPQRKRAAIDAIEDDSDLSENE